LIDACCMAAAIRCIVNRFHCLSSTVTGVLLTPTGARRARVETGGADRAEPDRPQGLDRAELRSRAVNFPTHHPNSRARESSANMGTCIVRTIWFESQSGSHWQRGDTRTAALYHGEARVSSSSPSRSECGWPERPQQQWNLTTGGSEEVLQFPAGMLLSSFHFFLNNN
jgi:hypothetical protein